MPLICGRKLSVNNNYIIIDHLMTYANSCKCMNIYKNIYV